MARLVWDKLEDRFYEIGADHAVLYVPDENDVFYGVPWNGLTKVSKETTRETESTYFDGVKIQDFIKQTQFKGSMSAVMYPPEFERVEGSYEMKCGVYLGEQPPGLFGLAYRSKIGDVHGDNAGYKLHILYNLHATPTEKSYETMNESPKLMEFSWDLESIPEFAPGFKPTAEITIDSRKTDPLLLLQLENILYGSSDSDAYLPSFIDLFSIIDAWFRLLVTLDDDPDSPTNGLFTVQEQFEGTHISENEDGTWEIVDADAEFVDTDTYVLTTTYCGHSTSLALISISSPGDETWTASTDHDEFFTVDNDPESPTYGMFTIENATLVWSNESGYRITDTFPD